MRIKCLDCGTGLKFASYVFAMMSMWGVSMEVHGYVRRALMSYSFKLYSISG